MDEQKKVNVEENARIQADNDSNRRAESRLANERVRENSRRTEEQRRIDTMRHEQAQHDNDFRLQREEQSRADERRRSEARRKEAQKSKYPYGLRNGNDIVTMTARLVYDLGKSVKKDIGNIRDRIRENHEKALEKRAVSRQMTKDIYRDIERIKAAEMQKKEPQEKEQQQPGRVGKESPTMERVQAHERDLKAKVEAHIKSKDEGRDHDMARGR